MRDTLIKLGWLAMRGLQHKPPQQTFTKVRPQIYFLEYAIDAFTKRGTSQKLKTLEDGKWIASSSNFSLPKVHCCLAVQILSPVVSNYCKRLISS